MSKIIFSLILLTNVNAYNSEYMCTVSESKISSHWTGDSWYVKCDCGANNDTKKSHTSWVFESDTAIFVGQILYVTEMGSHYAVFRPTPDPNSYLHTHSATKFVN